VFPHTVPRNRHVEAVACQVSLACGQELGILCVYRSPSSTSDDNELMIKILDNFLQNNFRQNIIVGDFNFPEINWSTNNSPFSSSFFFNFCQENFLTQHVLVPTRNVSANTLDLVLTTVGTDLVRCSVTEEFGTSDHSILLLAVQAIPQTRRRRIKRRNLKNVDWSRLSHLMPSSSDWQRCLSTNDIDTVWNCFVSVLSSALDKIAPYRYVSARNFTSSPKVRTVLRLKRRSFSIFRNNPTTHNRINYERAIILAEKALLDDLSRRENDVIGSPNVKSFWSYVNRRLSRVCQIDHIIRSGVEIRDSLDIANEFNDYFTSIFSPSVSIPISSPKATTPVLDAVAITEDDVLAILNHVPATSSVDSDGISYKILKCASLYLVTYLTQIYNLSLNSSSIPEAWRVAIITPIHKKGPKNRIENYRPISVTSCCLRVLERHLTRTINKFLRDHNILHTSQHGFISGRSTDTLLISFYDFVTACADKGHCVDAIFFDFSKAFDCVPHHTLMSRIESCGFRGSLLNWISDFLFNRSQRVRIVDSLSAPSSVTSGVIQGSVLGPTLFNIFVDSADSYLDNCRILKYADDLRIFLSSPKGYNNLISLQDKVQSDILNLNRWAVRSGMSFNAEKSFYVTCGGIQNPRCYTLNNSHLPLNCTFNDLGIAASNSPIKFKKHIDSIVSKAYSKLGLINKVFRFKNKNVTLRLFKAFVRPSLEYGSIIWSPHTVMDIKKIEKVQARMCRMIPELKGRSYQEQLSDLGILSLETRRLRYQLIMIYKMCKGFINMDPSELFDMKNDRRLRGHAMNIVQKHANTSNRLNFFSVSAIPIWNSLSQYDVDAPTVLAFKSRLSNFFKMKGIW